LSARRVAPQTFARTGGFLYLFIIVAALFGEAYARGAVAKLFEIAEEPPP
jgi:biotin transporter BioY